MLLPEVQRRGEIHFKVAKFLPYNWRLWIIFVLLIAGFALQFFVDIWVGAAVLLVATLLSLVRGYSNVVHVGGKSEWRPTDRKKLEEILAINEKSKRWDQSLIDITCGEGFLAFILVAGVVALVAYQFAQRGDDWLLTVWIADAVVLLIPHWVTGVRRILTNPPLIVRIQLLLRMWDEWTAMRQEDEEMHPQLEVRAGSGGEIPENTKLILASKNAPAEFLGLQLQVGINSVQGNDYPYFYGVLVARPEFRLLNRLNSLTEAGHRPGDQIVVEPDRQDDVEVIVIRQRTTKTSGYHTKPAACTAILEYSVALMREILK